MMGKKKRQILPEEDFTIIVHKDPIAPKRKIPITTISTQQRRHAPILPPGAKYESIKMHTSQRRVQEDCRRTAFDKTFEVGEPGPSFEQKVAVEVDFDQKFKKRNRLFEPLAQLRLPGADSRRLKCCSKCNGTKKVDVSKSCDHPPSISIERNTVISVPSTLTTVESQEKQKPSTSADVEQKSKSSQEKFIERQKRFAAPPVIVVPENKTIPDLSTKKTSVHVIKRTVQPSGISSATASAGSTVPETTKPKEVQKSHQPTASIPLLKKIEESKQSIVHIEHTQAAVEESEETGAATGLSEANTQKSSFGNDAVSISKPASLQTTIELKIESDMRLGKRVTFPSRNGKDTSPSAKKKRISLIRPPSPSLPPHLQCPPMKHMIEATPSTSAEFVEVKKSPVAEEKEETKKEENHISSQEKPQTIANSRKSALNSIAKRLTIPGIIAKPTEEEEPMPKINFINPRVIRTKEGKRILPFFTNKYIFSNHFPCPGLMVNGRKFCCTEQYYMWRKAKFGRNEAAASAILMSTDPKQMKLIGSSIENFDEAGWKRVSWKYMAEANFAKYKQFDELRYQLMRTMGSILVEASPTDKWWGAGLDIDSPLLKEPRRWPGRNVMGNLLMEIREALAEKQEYQYEVSRAKRSPLIEDH